MKKRIISSIPFLIISLIVLYTWFEIITTEYIATWRHYVALTLVAINAALYFVKYKKAVLLTGIILILATFNLLSFFTIIQTSFLGFGSVTTPEIQLKSLLLLVIYCAINFNLLINWYLDMKEGRAKKKLKNN
ncbi:MAG TPA: hypothetical protein VF939_22895 [Puia sp.]